MTEAAVRPICVEIAPQFELDPVLALALCQQESDYRHDAARLEQGFYRRYTEKDSLATTAEVLLACSYGLMQTMGQILREHGYFQYFLDINNRSNALNFRQPLSPIAICKGIDWYMERPREQVLWGCKHLRKKIDLAKGDIRKALLFWNGGGRPEYPDEVLEKFTKLGGKLV